VSELDEAARALLLSPEGNAAYGPQRLLFLAARTGDPKENFSRAREAVRFALNNGALLHPGRRWCLGVDCWEIICELPTPVERPQRSCLDEEE